MFVSGIANYETIVLPCLLVVNPFFPVLEKSLLTPNYEAIVLPFCAVVNLFFEMTFASAQLLLY